MMTSHPANLRPGASTPPRAPSDAGALSAVLARGDLAAIDAERARLHQVVKAVAPRRSLIVEARLRALTRRRLELLAAIRSISR